MALDGTEVLEIARQNWGDEQIRLRVGQGGFVSRLFSLAELFTEIAWLESSWDPTENGRFGELGLWQIHPVHFEALRAAGIINTPFDLHDPQINGRAAKFVWDDAGGKRGTAASGYDGLEPWTTADQAIANVTSDAVAGQPGRNTQLGKSTVFETPGLEASIPGVSGTLGALEAVGAFFAQLLDREMWLRIGIGVGGVLLVVLAVVLANRGAIAAAVPAARAVG